MFCIPDDDDWHDSHDECENWAEEEAPPLAVLQALLVVQDGEVCKHHIQLLRDNHLPPAFLKALICAGNLHPQRRHCQLQVYWLLSLTQPSPLTSMVPIKFFHRMRLTWRHGGFHDVRDPSGQRRWRHCGNNGQSLPQRQVKDDDKHRYCLSKTVTLLKSLYNCGWHCGAAQAHFLVSSFIHCNFCHCTLL